MPLAHAYLVSGRGNTHGVRNLRAAGRGANCGAAALGPAGQGDRDATILRLA